MKKLKYYISGLFLLLTIMMFAQKPLVEAVQSAQELNKKPFEIKEILSPVTGFRNGKVSDDVKEAFYFTYNTNVADKLIKAPSSYITLQIPHSNSNNDVWVLHLVEVPASFYDYKIITSSGKRYSGDTSNGKHYRGVIQGMEERSIVAISLFRNEMMGLISVKEEGNFNLGKIKNTDTHVLYRDSNLLHPPVFNCDTPDNDITEYDKNILMNNLIVKSGTDKCVKIYFETEYDIYEDKGSINNVENYITGLFNQMASLYIAENIITTISEIKIWDTSDPYTATTPTALLSQFQNEISSIDGDLGQLLTFRSIGGGKAAGFEGICNTDVDESLAVSGIYASYSVFPTYSWSVYVVSHEFGHLFGSRHTHACVWNGNNTAIDGCAGSTEEDDQGNLCPVPSIPPQGGTIMSYCHLSSAGVGINFSLGFSLQPGNVIRNTVINSNCLTSCCPDNLSITQNIEEGDYIFEVGTSIIGTNEILNGAEATYDAGSIVSLLPGFSAKSGSSFYAFIDGCGGLRTGSSKDTNSEEEIAIVESQKVNQLSAMSSPSLKVYPNPFSDDTVIEYTITGENKSVDITIFNLAGKEVRTVVSNEENAAGTYNITFDSSHLSVGVYYCRLRIGEEVLTRKMILER